LTFWETRKRDGDELGIQNVNERWGAREARRLALEED